MADPDLQEVSFSVRRVKREDLSITLLPGEVLRIVKVPASGQNEIVWKAKAKDGTKAKLVICIDGEIVPS